MDTTKNPNPPRSNNLPSTPAAPRATGSSPGGAAAGPGATSPNAVTDAVTGADQGGVTLEGREGLTSGLVAELMELADPLLRATELESSLDLSSDLSSDLASALGAGGADADLLRASSPPAPAVFVVREAATADGRVPIGAAWLREVQPSGTSVLVAPTNLPGMDRLLEGGLRLCHKGEGALAPTTTIGISGAPSTGKTTLALHLAASLCRAHGRGAALYLAPDGLAEVRALLATYDNAGFAWVNTEHSRAFPAVATGIVLSPFVAPEGSAPRAPATPPLLPRVEEVQRMLPREMPLRAVVVDQTQAQALGASGGVVEAEIAALGARLGLAGISLIVIGATPLPGADLSLSLTGADPETGGRALRVVGARLSPAHPAASLLALGDGGLRVMPPASLYPAVCRAPTTTQRALPLSRFGDATLDRRAADRAWLTPQCRVLILGPDPTCTLLLTNRFLAEAPQRLAIFFTGPSSRVPGGDNDRGVAYVRRAPSGAEIAAQVADVLTAFRARWPRTLLQAPRVALIDPAGLYDDGRHDSAPAVLDAALLSLCAEAGVMALVCRTTRELPPWWSDYDLVLHLPQRAQGVGLTVRVVVDRVSI